MLLEFLHSPNFILSILFNNIFTLISENVFWIEHSPAPAMEALYSIINEIVVHVKKEKRKKRRSPSGKSYILYRFEICFLVFKILSMAYMIFCLYVRYWQPWLLLKCRSKATSLRGLYSPFELFLPLINLTMYIATIQRHYVSFVQKGNSKTVYLYMAQTMQTCRGCSTTVQSELIISWVCNIQGQRKMSCGPVKKVIINKFKGKKD